MAYDFSLEGAKWGSPELGTAGGTVTWAVDESISQADLQSINVAFAEWSKVANIQFQEVSSTAVADIDFSNSAIDGAGNVPGVTGFSFSGGQLKSADVQFDSGDNLSGAELTLVATHEIGHAIGLDHFNDAPAVMNSTANFSLTGLAQSDIDGILALYGASTTDTSDAGTGTTPPDIATGDTGTTPDMADQFQRAGVFAVDQLDPGIAGDRIVEIGDRAVQRHRHRALGERGRDALGDLEAGDVLGIFALGAIGEGEGDFLHGFGRFQIRKAKLESRCGCIAVRHWRLLKLTPANERR